MSRFPPRRIIVPVDFSERSLSAWRFARELAGRLRDCSVEAVTVASLFETRESFLRLELGQAERRRLKARLAAWLPDADALHVAEGELVLALLRTVARRRADLVVMATEGVTGLQRLRRGSATEELVRSSKVPVLSLRGPAPLPFSVLAPVNLKPGSLAGFHFARALAKALRARLTVLHVKEGDAPAGPIEALRSGAVEVKIVEGEPVPAIVEEAGRHDLVVLAARAKGFLRDALLGTTAEQVLRLSPSPVLSVPPAAEPAPPPPGGARRKVRGARARRRPARAG